MSSLFYTRVTEDKTSIILEDSDGKELSRYANQQELQDAVAALYGSNTMLVPRKQD